MRINSVNNFTYIAKINNNSSNRQITVPDTFKSPPSFKGLFTSSSKKISEYFIKDPPYEDIINRANFIECCRKTVSPMSLYKLKSQAQALLLNSKELTDSALWAAHFLLFKINDGTLSKLENQDYILTLLREIVEANDQSVILEVINPDDMDLFIKANPEIDLNKHYYIGIRHGYSLLLKAAKFNNTELLRYLVSRDDVDLYNKELWLHVLKHSERTQNLLREIPDEKFSLEQFELTNGYNLFTQLLSKGFNQDVPESFFADTEFEEYYRKIYDKNGTFSLDEMEKIVTYKNFKKFIKARLNIAGDRFGHLLAEISVNNPDEMQKLINIVSHLKSAGYAFNVVNDLGQTPLDKAIEAENKTVEELLRRYT